MSAWTKDDETALRHEIERRFAERTPPRDVLAALPEWRVGRSEMRAWVSDHLGGHRIPEEDIEAEQARIAWYKRMSRRIPPRQGRDAVKRTSYAVVNRSRYPTAILRAAFVAALRTVPLPRGAYRLYVVPGHAAGMTGHLDGTRPLAAWGRADCPGTRVWMAAAPPGKPRCITTRRQWADWLWTLEHEAMHLVGCRHGTDYAGHDARMGAALASIDPDAWAPAWAAGIPLPTWQPAQAKPRPVAADTRGRRLAHATAMLERARQDAARAQRRAAKWGRRVSALAAAERRFAASKE